MLEYTKKYVGRAIMFKLYNNGIHLLNSFVRRFIVKHWMCYNVCSYLAGINR